jgi:hypothetical protein
VVTQRAGPESWPCGMDEKYQGKDVGSWVLDSVVGIAPNVGEAAAVRYLTLHSLPEPRRVRWYAACSFEKKRARGTGSQNR